MAETPNKNDDVINLEADSDEDGASKPSPRSGNSIASPFAAMNKNSNSTSTIKEYGQVFYINPPRVAHGDKDTVPLRGVVATVCGRKYEYAWVQPLWNSEDWVSETGVVPRVFDLKLDGNIIKQTGNAKYNRKMLIWLLPDDMPDLTDDQCTAVYFDYMEKTVKSKYNYFKSFPPLHSDIGLVKLNSWHKTITIDDLDLLFKNSTHFQKYAGIKSFFKFSQNNLYSFWPPGSVPISHIKDFKLRSVLHPDDASRYNESVGQLSVENTPIKNEGSSQINNTRTIHQSQGNTVFSSAKKNLNNTFEIDDNDSPKKPIANTNEAPADTNDKPTKTNQKRSVSYFPIFVVYLYPLRI